MPWKRTHHYVFVNHGRHHHHHHQEQHINFARQPRPPPPPSPSPSPQPPHLLRLFREQQLQTGVVQDLARRRRRQVAILSAAPPRRGRLAAILRRPLAQRLQRLLEVVQGDMVPPQLMVQTALNRSSKVAATPREDEKWTRRGTGGGGRRVIRRCKEEARDPVWRGSDSEVGFCRIRKLCKAPRPHCGAFFENALRNFLPVQAKT